MINFPIDLSLERCYNCGNNLADGYEERTYEDPDGMGSETIYLCSDCTWEEK